MRFNPKSESEVQDDRYKAFEPGTYKFECERAEEKTSRNGNDMIEVRLKLFSNDGRKTNTCFDYLMPVGAMAYKFRHFCYSVGLGEQYERGEVNQFDCVDRMGQVQVAKGEDNKGRERNEVIDYVPASGVMTPPKDEGIHLSSKSAEREKHQPVEEEDIPF